MSGTRRTEKQRMELVNDYKTSNLNITAWCREKGISKNPFYPYLGKLNN